MFISVNKSNHADNQRIHSLHFHLIKPFIPLTTEQILLFRQVWILFAASGKNIRGTYTLLLADCQLVDSTRILMMRPAPLPLFFTLFMSLYSFSRLFLSFSTVVNLLNGECPPAKIFKGMEITHGHIYVHLCVKQQHLRLLLLLMPLQNNMQILSASTDSQSQFSSSRSGGCILLKATKQLATVQVSKGGGREAYAEFYSSTPNLLFHYSPFILCVYHQKLSYALPVLIHSQLRFFLFFSIILIIKDQKSVIP